MLKYLTKGHKYTFEIRSNDCETVIIHMGNERIYMTKGRNSFKETNKYIHSDTISIYGDDIRLITFISDGEDVDYPIIYNTFSLNYKLFQPLIGTLKKRNEYTFELKCENVEYMAIKYGEYDIELSQIITKYYYRKLTIDPSTTASSLFIIYGKDDNGTIIDNYLYKYKLE